MSSITIVSDAPNCGVTCNRHYDDRNSFIKQARGHIGKSSSTFDQNLSTKFEKSTDLILVNFLDKDGWVMGWPTPSRLCQPSRIITTRPEGQGNPPPPRLESGPRIGECFSAVE